MKAPPFKRTPVPDVTGQEPAYVLSRAQVVSLIASRAPRKRGDDLATMHNRVSSCLAYGVRKRALVPVAPRAFRLGDVVRWARVKWPGRFDDLPITSWRTSEMIVDNASAVSVLQ